MHSPCIDVGDPRSDWLTEPRPNGGRINMGAYGGTAQASESIERAEFSLAPGWNLVSIAVEPFDPARESVFPSATCVAVWEYRNPGGYAVPATCGDGRG